MENELHKNLSVAQEALQKTKEAIRNIKSLNAGGILPKDIEEELKLLVKEVPYSQQLELHTSIDHNIENRLVQVYKLLTPEEERRDVNLEYCYANHNWESIELMDGERDDSFFGLPISLLDKSDDFFMQNSDNI